MNNIRLIFAFCLSSFVLLSNNCFAQNDGDSVIVGTTVTKKTITTTTKTSSFSSSFNVNMVKVSGDSSTRKFNTDSEDKNGPNITLIPPVAMRGVKLI